MGLAESYPLCWPEGFPRTPSSARVWGSIKLSMAAAAAELHDEVRMLGGTDVVLSTNIPTNRSGMPYGTYREPSDPGAAIYFKWNGKPVSMACDRYDKVNKNVRALGLTIQAMRAIERHGSSDLLDRAFRGFAALPATASLSSWVDVLGVSAEATEAEIDAAYRRAALVAHPDKATGSDEAMSRLNLAYEDALACVRRTA